MNFKEFLLDFMLNIERYCFFPCRYSTMSEVFVMICNFCIVCDVSMLFISINNLVYRDMLNTPTHYAALWFFSNVLHNCYKIIKSRFKNYSFTIKKC